MGVTQESDDRRPEAHPIRIDYLQRVAIEEVEFLDNWPLRVFPFLDRIARMPRVQRAAARVEQRARRWARQITQARRRIPGLSRDDCGFADIPLPAGSPLASCQPLPRLWIDVTMTYRTANRGGVARVCRELANAAARTAMAFPVVIEDGVLRPYFSGPSFPGTLEADSSITYVVIDGFWEPLDEYIGMFAKLRARGAKTAVCFHDIMPLYCPVFFGNYFVKLFASAFPRVVGATDGCVGVSNYTVSKVRDFIAHHRLRHGAAYPSGSFPLGANFQTGPDGLVRSQIKQLFDRPFVFSSVGTIEPRKGYAITLDAFEMLWRDGIDVTFVILGRDGWVAKALRRRLMHHPESGKRLIWFRDASDAEVSYVYKHTYCLIQASITEGFGLPVIEASALGAPVLASDNEVFREVAGNAISYFETGNPADLAAKIKATLLVRPAKADVKYVSWDESLNQLVATIRHLFGPPSLAFAEPDETGTDRHEGPSAAA